MSLAGNQKFAKFSRVIKAKIIYARFNQFTCCR